MKTYNQVLIQGIPLICEASGISKHQFFSVLDASFRYGINTFDTAADYGNSEIYFGEYISNNSIPRNTFSVISKIGNNQQLNARQGNVSIEKCVSESCDRLNVEYCDVMLLHWPYPNVYIHNWESLLKVAQRGLARKIGIANADIRHIEAIRNAGLPLPQIIQTEIHPFRTCVALREYCKENNIELQACTSLCSMIPMVSSNDILNDISHKYKKSIVQIILRWHLQNGINPVFRSYNEGHIKDISEVFRFEIDGLDMERINSLNMNYRYHPESINCPGY